MSDREDDGPGRPPGGYDVGYGKPPLERRFKPGKSGNRKGRPKGAKNRKTIVKAVANEMHTVPENGKRRQRSTLELVLLRLRNIALEGKNTRAFDEIHRLAKAYEPQVADGVGGYLVVSATATEEEAIAESKKRNAMKKRPPGYGIN